MSDVTLTRFPEGDYVPVTQVGQFINVSFAFVNDKYEEIMQHVKCKDFMNVPTWQRKKGGEIHQVYGWRYSFKKTPYDVNVTRIALSFENSDQGKNFVKNVVKHLNVIEAKYDIKPTKVLTTQEADVYVVEGDTVWQSNCWKMSMYMMYLRRCGHTNFNKPHANSSDFAFMGRLKAYPQAEHNMLTNLHVNYDDVDMEYDLYTAHSSSGVMVVMNYQRYLDPTTGELIPEAVAYGLKDWQMKLIHSAFTPNPAYQIKEAA